MLTQRYEALRHDAVTPSAGSQDVRGLALLERRGMAAWMRGVSEAGVRTVSTLISPGLASTTLRHETPGPGVEQALVNIVAAMALANAMEAFA